MVTVYKIKVEFAHYHGQFYYLNDKYPRITIERKSYGNEVNYAAKVKFEYETFTNINPCEYVMRLEMKINASHPYTSKAALHELIRYLMLVKALVENDKETFEKLVQKSFVELRQFEDIRKKILTIEDRFDLIEPIMI